MNTNIVIKENNLSSIKKPNIFKAIFSSLNRNKEFCIMVAPFLLLTILFHYVPLYGITIAFQDFRYNLGILKSPFIGLENFRFLFTSPDLPNLLRNTVLYNLMFISASTVVNLAIALMLFEIKNKYFVKAQQTIMFMPYFLSWVVVSYILYSLLSTNYGILNQVLSSLGMEPVQWYSKGGLWPGILMFSVIWKGTGYGSIIYYAVLIGIDTEYYEAAKIDGANRLQMALKISLPFLRKMIIIMLLFSIGGMVRSDFGLFYFLPMDNPLLYDATQTIDTYVYRALRNNGDFGIPAAIGLVQSLIGFMLIVIANAAVRKVDNDSALF